MKKPNDNNAPITEFFDDEMGNLHVFFNNGKKEFWRFDKVKEMGIDKCVFFLPRRFSELTEITKKCELVYEFMSASTISPVYLYDNKVLIALTPLGGSASANLMEELIHVGIKYFMGMGSCGAIQGVPFEQLFIPTKAIRDEGTSYHYLPPSRYAETSEKLNSSLESILIERKVDFSKGIVWTTDAMYRETPKRIAARIKDGATGVEMETASLAAVAKARGVEYTCLLYYSDFNDGIVWESRIYDRIKLRNEIFNLCLEALMRVK